MRSLVCVEGNGVAVLIVVCVERDDVVVVAVLVVVCVWPQIFVAELKQVRGCKTIPWLLFILCEKEI